MTGGEPGSPCRHAPQIDNDNNGRRAAGVGRPRRRDGGGQHQPRGLAGGHNELLGGHGNDTIVAVQQGDVIWADYKPSGQPSTQTDRIFGGAGNDFIYASHGTNLIAAGGGKDYIKAHYGRGTIDCGGGADVLYISRRAQKGYKIRHCETISHKTLGY